LSSLPGFRSLTGDALEIILILSCFSRFEVFKVSARIFLKEILEAVGRRKLSSKIRAGQKSERREGKG
jgi:hypothetical protein